MGKHSAEELVREALQKTVAGRLEWRATNDSPAEFLAALPRRYTFTLRVEREPETKAWRQRFVLRDELDTELFAVTSTACPVVGELYDAIRHTVGSEAVDKAMAELARL